MNPVITAFERSPDRGRGHARDMRLRWALEEVGVGYETRLLSFEAMKQPAHKRIHPFGQIPTYEEDSLFLFESGAILLHIADRHPGLLPTEPGARARAITWMFAALNTIEPPVFDLSILKIVEGDRPWYEERKKVLETRIEKLLADLSAYLGTDEWLVGSFSAADILMVTVLRRLIGTGLLETHSNLVSYTDRAEARPAWKRAFMAQLAVFEASQSAS